MCRSWRLSASGDQGDDDVGGMSVEVLSSSVVDRRGAWVSVAGGDLHVSQRDADVEGGHDERGPKHVRVNGTEAGSLADRPDQRCAMRRSRRWLFSATKDRALVTFADRKIDRASGPGNQGARG